MSGIPIVAVVGRPNVGKSTFFNRVMGAKLQVVEDIPGVTRDRNYALVENYSFPFYIVDTGGFEKESEDIIQKQVSRQALAAAEEADVVIAVFDGLTGLQPGDEDVVEILRRFNKPVMYLVNKCDGIEHVPALSDFYSMGVDTLHHCTALHGRGVKEFIEECLRALPDFEERLAAEIERQAKEVDVEAEFDAELEEDAPDWVDEAEEWFEQDEEARELRLEKSVVEDDDLPDFAPVFLPEDEHSSSADYEKEHRLLPLPRRAVEDDLDDGPAAEGDSENTALPLIRVAIIGRPNVGKSTLLNTLTGEERAITSPIAGTTRDSLHQPLTHEDQEFLLVDTAGMRKKGRVGDRIEEFSVLRALRSINECDVAVVLLDAVEGPTDQDAKIVGLAHEQGKGILLVVNKWDLVEKDHKIVKEFEKRIRHEFKFTPYAPLIFISAKTGKRCLKVLDLARELALDRTRRVSTYKLNKILTKKLATVSGPSYRGRPIKLFYAAQVEIAPPRFLLFFNYPRQVHFSYLRLIKNTIRDHFGFQGTDIKLITKRRTEKKA